jgi:DNA-directed RNA polymerase subunit RPC12/RpoP
MKEYIIYRCNVCGNYFILLRSQVKYSERESKYITCPYHGKHKDIRVCGTYDSIKECMMHDSYRRERGRLKQRGWG